MKKLMLLLSVVALAGCSSPSRGPGSFQARLGSTALAAQDSAAPRYEYQLDVEHADGATPFLHLTELPAQ